ncbi:MAG: DNA methyltransferase [Dehalococcoidia bacterium]|nr:DNA methyltransferase [Dehalococcoidia bacterium]
MRPGGHVVVATSPLFNHVVSQALASAGFEKRGEIVRLVRTLRGGDRPKGAEAEFAAVSAMPRSSWEPWLLFRKRLEGTLADNLRKWGAGALRRPSADVRFTDVIASGRTPRDEKAIAPHPSLKPQAFLRQLVHAALPLEEGVVLDLFAGSGSTLAACEAVGRRAIGIESDARYVAMAKKAVPQLVAIEPAVHSALVVHMWGQDTADLRATSGTEDRRRNSSPRPFASAAEAPVLFVQLRRKNSNELCRLPVLDRHPVDIDLVVEDHDPATLDIVALPATPVSRCLDLNALVG